MGGSQRRHRLPTAPPTSVTRKFITNRFKSCLLTFTALIFCSHSTPEYVFLGPACDGGEAVASAVASAVGRRQAAPARNAVKRAPHPEAVESVREPQRPLLQRGVCGEVHPLTMSNAAAANKSKSTDQSKVNAEGSNTAKLESPRRAPPPPPPFCGSPRVPAY